MVVLCLTGAPLCSSRCVIFKTTDKTHSHICAFPRLFLICSTHRYPAVWKQSVWKTLQGLSKSQFILCDLAICSLKKLSQHMVPAHCCSVSLHCCFCLLYADSSMCSLPTPILWWKTAAIDRREDAAIFGIVAGSAHYVGPTTILQVQDDKRKELRVREQGGHQATGMKRTVQILTL